MLCASQLDHAFLRAYSRDRDDWWVPHAPSIATRKTEAALQTDIGCRYRNERLEVVVLDGPHRTNAHAVEQRPVSWDGRVAFGAHLGESLGDVSQLFANRFCQG